MHFLEECRKSEEEGKVGQAKAAPKAKAAAATVPPTKEDELTKQFRYQQHQIDALVGQVKNLVSVVRATQASSNVTRPGNPSLGEGVLGVRPKAHGEVVFREGACPLRSSQDPLPSHQLEAPSKSRGMPKHPNPISAGNVERWGI